MGCLLSTESQDRSNGPEQGKVVNSTTGDTAAVETISTSIPSIPGWNGIPTIVMPVQVTFEMKRTWRDEPISMDPLLNAINAQNTAGQGFSLAAVFMPALTEGPEPGDRGKAMEVEWKGCCCGSIESKAMCIFQKISEAQMAPIETLMLSSSMREKYKPSSINIVPVEGYEQLYSQLSEAGEKLEIIINCNSITGKKFFLHINLFLPPVIGNQAFSLSAVFGKPNMRTLRRGERHSKQKTVHLVCQKNQGDQNPPSQYLIINCQIIISQHWRSVTASIPDLTNFLSSYCTQV